jgi:hypothetical protein
MSNSLDTPHQNDPTRQYVLDGYTAKYEQRRTKSTLKRLGAAVVTGLLLVGTGATLKNMGTDYQFSEATRSVTAEQGDTLSSLANDIPGIEHIDKSIAIDEIKELNPTTIVGDTVPAYAEIILPASVVEEGSVVDDAATPDNN